MAMCTLQVRVVLSLTIRVVQERSYQWNLWISWTLRDPNSPQREGRSCRRGRKVSQSLVHTYVLIFLGSSNQCMLAKTIYIRMSSSLGLEIKSKRKLAKVQSYSEFEVVARPPPSVASMIFTPPPVPPAPRSKTECQDEAIPVLYKIFQQCIEVSGLAVSGPSLFSLLFLVWEQE